MLIVYRISDSRSVPNQWYASKIGCTQFLLDAIYHFLVI